MYSKKIVECMSVMAMESLYDMLKAETLTDAIIRLDDGTKFKIHRAILCACSNYFRAVFTTKLHEHEIIDLRLPGVGSTAMKLIIQYAYIRKLDLTESIVYELLLTSDYLCVIGVMKLCFEFINARLNPLNCISIMLFARHHFFNDLAENAYKYLMRHFVTVVKISLETVHLSHEDFRTIISSDELNVKSEELVWEAIIKWIEYDPNNRKSYIVEFMKAIRLGLLDTQYFLEHVKDNKYVMACEESRPLIIDTLKFLYDLEMITHKDGEVSTPEIARPRVPHEILFAIGGWSGGSPTDFIETYDTRADRWVKVNEVDPNGPRAYHGTAVIGFSIYVIGGFDGMDYFSSCRCFNAVTKDWKEVAPMNARRCYVSVAVLNDIIYAMGGFDGHHRQNTAEKYNYKTNQWSVIASMNMHRSDASACTLHNKIYITGGFNGQECLHSAEVYDAELDQWTTIAPMRSRRSGVSCIAYHDHVYVVGGFNGISRMCSGEKYNPSNNQWLQIPDMYNPRSNFAIEVIDEMVFAIGGFNGVTTIYHVECYDDKTNEWYEATDMNIYRSALSACVISGLPNVRDYIHKHREKLMEEKRQKMLALELARQHDQTIRQEQNGLLPVNIAQRQQLNIVLQLNNELHNMNNNVETATNNNEIDDENMVIDDQVQLLGPLTHTNIENGRNNI